MEFKKLTYLMLCGVLATNPVFAESPLSISPDAESAPEATVVEVEPPAPTEPPAATADVALSPSTFGDVEAGYLKTQTCVACHGVDGNSVMPEWPKIAGQHPNYLYQQLTYFKQGEQGPRHNAQMLGMVVTLTDDDMRNLAAFYAQQTQIPGETEAKYVELGQRIFHGGLLEKGVPACAGCHGPMGMGNGLANYPRISGQHPAYTALQLKAYQAGTRKSDPGAMMRMISAKLNDVEIEAVSHYIAGLKPRKA